MRSLLSLALLSASVSAFSILPRQSVVRVATTLLKAESTSEASSVNVARAKDCAEHFGKCSVAEIEELKDNLHKERLQRFVFDDATSTTTPSAESLEHQIWEEELDVQLSLLKKQEEDPTLFPEVEDAMQELPHLKDHTVAQDAEKLVHDVELMAMEQESIMDEETMETFVICACIAAVLFLPQLFN